MLSISLLWTQTGICVESLGSMVTYTEPVIGSHRFIHYSDVTWATWRLQSPVIRIVVQQRVQYDIKDNITDPRHWFFLGGNPPVTGEFPHKGPVMRKAFPNHDVIMKHRTNIQYIPQVIASSREISRCTNIHPYHIEIRKVLVRFKLNLSAPIIREIGRSNVLSYL